MENPAQTETTPPRDPSRLESTLAHVRSALSGLQYGQITITVQDGVVIQIERTERTRLGRVKR